MPEVLLVLAVSWLAWGSAVLSGLFFVFSNCAMGALAALPPPSGMAAMQGINRRILNPLFLLLFFGTAFAGLVTVILAVTQAADPVRSWLLAGGLLHLVGGFGVTAIRNVPLNNRLAAMAADDPVSEVAWEEYTRRWLRWNHVRTVATSASTVCCLVGLSVADWFQHWPLRD